MAWPLAALLYASAWLLARNRLKRTDEALLAAGLLACTEVLTAITLLGWLGLLRPAPAIIFTLLLAAGNLAAALHRRRPLRPRLSFRRLALLVPWPLWPALGLAAAVLYFRLKLAAALPFDSWDGLSYHVPILWRWLQQGNFDLAGWVGPARYFPWNGELLPAWLALLGGALDSAKLAQALALPVLGAAGAVLGRRLAGLRWAVPSALALVCLPIAVIHAGIPYVDLIYSAFWLAAAAAALCLERTRRPVYLFLYAAAFGLAAGTKSTLYFQLPLLLPLLRTLYSDEALARRALRLAPGLLALAALCGASSYLHNWWTTGNPIFPYAFRIGVKTIFKGVVSPGELLVTVESWFVSSPWGWLWYPFHETMKGATVYGTENGFGPLFAAGWAFWPYALWRARRARDRGAFWFLLLLPATAFFFFALHPTREQRYVIFIAAVPILSLVYVFRKAAGGLRALAAAGWTLGIAWGLFGVLNYAGRDRHTVNAWDALRGAGQVRPFKYYREKYGALGEAWAALDARLAPGDVVATNYGELMLPWAGVPARGRVIVVTADKTPYPDTFTATDTAAWLALLERLNVRYFALWVPAWYPEEGKEERENMEKLAGRFIPAGNWSSADFGKIELYELARTAPGSGVSPAAPPAPAKK
ncbi:MAG: hypothetical protein A2X31_13285 [Elusimicrobia bacterium GWB2_63_22]|nr:MAG: hypothetical protein A2X31_13285 [Elusimicrobia bacterium GWB2_63_22]